MSVVRDGREYVGAVANGLKISPSKLSLITCLIAGKSVGDALNQLLFCKKAGSVLVKKLLMSAIANAQNNFGLDISQLFVYRVEVGKNMTLKRMMPKARGRGARIFKRYSHLRVVLVEGGSCGTES